MELKKTLEYVEILENDIKSLNNTDKEYIQIDKLDDDNKMTNKSENETYSIIKYNEIIINKLKKQESKTPKNYNE